MRKKTVEERKAKLFAKIIQLQEKRAEMVDQASIHSKTSRTISCAICEKRLIRAEIRGEKCPICGAELRSYPALRKIELLDDRITFAKSEMTKLEKV